jgi:hypothetical protein
MFDRPPCRPRHGGFLLGLARSGWVPVTEQTGHDVESALAGSSGFDRIGGQPDMGAMTKAPLFSFIDCLCGQAMVRHRTGAPAGWSHPSALDLDEGEHRTPAHDQIDLDAVGADVARDDAIPSRFEKSGGSSFTFVSQILS